jgi:hypothetical protein
MFLLHILAIVVALWDACIEDAHDCIHVHLTDVGKLEEKLKCMVALTESHQLQSLGHHDFDDIQST